VRMAALALTLCFYAMFGYMVNAWSDRAVDLAAGKRSALATLPDAAATALVGGVLLAGLACAVGLYGDQPLLLVLFGLAFVSAAAYSVPPLRFKERGFAGMLVSSVAQRALPALIVFEALGGWDPAAVGLCLLGGLVGMRYIVVHQLLDADNDLATGVRTVATTRGAAFLRRLQTRLLFPLEALTLAAVLALVSQRFPALAVAVAVFAAWNLVQYAVLESERSRRFSPVSYGIFADLYNFFLPTALSLLLAVEHPALWPVAAFNAVWLLDEFKRESDTVRRVLSTT